MHPMSFSMQWPTYKPAVHVPFFDADSYKGVNLDVAVSEHPSGLDLPLNDIPTLRFFFNLGVQKSREMLLAQYLDQSSSGTAEQQMDGETAAISDTGSGAVGLPLCLKLQRPTEHPIGSTTKISNPASPLEQCPPMARPERDARYSDQFTPANMNMPLSTQLVLDNGCKIGGFYTIRVPPHLSLPTNHLPNS